MILRPALCSMALCLAVLPFSPAHADSFTDAQKQEMGDVIRGYLLEHPEILKEMMAKLDEKEKKAAADAQAQALANSSQDIYHNANDAVVGNPNGDITIVEFMDYNCGYCKKNMAEMKAVLEQDKNVRVVMKEWPIFGADSEYAAKAAMAAAKQGKYWDLHQALFNAPSHVDAAVVDLTAKRVGIDVTKMKADMADKAIADNLGKTQGLADALQFTGTPGFLIGDTVVPGYIGKDHILAALADVRAKGGCKAC